MRTVCRAALTAGLVVASVFVGAGSSGAAGFAARGLTAESVQPSAIDRVATSRHNEAGKTAKRPPSKPLSLTATGGDSSIRMAWKKPKRRGSHPISGYLVQRSVSGGAWTTVTTVGPKVRAFTVAQLTNGTQVRVRVAAVSRGGTSKWSRIGVATLPTTVQVAAGTNATCALLPSRQVVCWGANNRGQLGIGSSGIPLIPVPVLVPGLTDVRQISVGIDHACALRGDGTVWCWGDALFGQLRVASVILSTATPVQIPGVESATQLSVGGYHACVRTATGGVQCWGNNDYAQTGGPFTSLANLPINSVEEVRAGRLHTCARLTSGAVQCWGHNSSGQAGGTPSMTNTVNPTAVPGITTARELALGESFSCARLEDGGAVCWGNGGSGQLGDGSTPPSTTTPQQVIDVGTITSIAAGQATVCAAYSDAIVRCWGSDFYGQQGNGVAGGSSSTPVVSGLGTARTVALGGATGCATRVGGRLVCAGRNNEGQLGIGTTVLSAVPVSPHGL